MNLLLHFHSVLAKRMTEFVAFKRMQGYRYATAAFHLACFDQFLVDENRDCKPLQLEVIRQYLKTTVALSTSTRQDQLSAIRQFSHYMHAFDPESPVLPHAMLPRHPRPTRFYRITSDQLQKLMNAASLLPSKEAIRSPCIRFLIGMLYCTGLRIAEVLKLNLSDVDLLQRSILVRKGKFAKDRMVAISPSTISKRKETMTLQPPINDSLPLRLSFIFWLATCRN